jgi:hypothetical protein
MSKQELIKKIMTLKIAKGTCKPKCCMVVK